MDFRKSTKFQSREFIQNFNLIKCFFFLKPNDNTATKDKLDSFLVRISEIETRSGFIFPQFTQTQKSKLATTSWPLPLNCDKSKKRIFERNGY